MIGVAVRNLRYTGAVEWPSLEWDAVYQEAASGGQQSLGQCCNAASFSVALA